MRITIKQIADIAGVHRSTVDKVIHNRKGVSDDVRERIQKIIDEVGYKPNVIGKALASQNKPVKIAALLLDVDAKEELKQGINEAYEEFSNFGLDIIFYENNSTDHIAQLNALNLAEEKGVEGIVISPIYCRDIKEKINELEEKGISVVTINTDIPESKRSCFIGQDGISAGRVAGELMGEILSQGGKVIEFTGSKSMTSPLERQLGFQAVIEERYPKIEIVEVIETNEDPLFTFSSAMEKLRDNSDVGGIYITCGGAAEVAKALRLNGRGEQIKMISFDLYQDILSYLQDGTIDFSIGQDLKNQGYKSIKILFDCLFNKKPIKVNRIKTRIDIRMKENIVMS